MMTSASKEYLDIKELSNFLGLKISRIRTLILKNEIPRIKVGRLVRFEKSQIIKWIEDKRIN